MDIKEEIKSVLGSLKKHGIDRRMAEKELGYGEFTIDSEISRGGNKKMLAALNLLLKVKILEKSTNEEERNLNLVAEPEENYGGEIKGEVEQSKLVKEVLRLRAVTDVLTNQFLQFSASLSGRSYRNHKDKDGTADLFDHDLNIRLQQLKTETL